jgi:hypothetical protein
LLFGAKRRFLIILLVCPLADPPLPHIYYFHMKEDTCHHHHPRRRRTKDNHSIATYLMPIRNPLSRIQSWFQFEKDIIPTRRCNQRQQQYARWKRGLLFVECYPNFVDLVFVFGWVTTAYSWGKITRCHKQQTCQLQERTQQLKQRATPQEQDIL